MHRKTALLFGVLVLSSVGCDSAPAISTTDGGMSDAFEEQPIGSVTYYADVRPILANHCVRCHSDGSIAPFVLDGYDAAAAMSLRIMAATRDRIMPPYLAEASGACNTYQDARRLMDREIGVLAAWHEQGTPMGDPAIAPPIVPPLPTLDGELTHLSIGTDYMPVAGSRDDYRCFIVEAPIASGPYFVTGYDFHPGNRRIVHHAAIFAPIDEESASTARMLDASAEGPGYPCYGGPSVNALLAAAWAPGTGATIYPRATGIQLEGGRAMIIQVHYNTAAGEGMSDRTTVDLQIATSGVVRAAMIPIVDTELALEPRMPGATESTMTTLQEYGFPEIPVHVYGVFPHMHTLGRRLHMEVVRAEDGSEACLVDVPRWDFNWQMTYFYEHPIEINPGDNIRITCTWDTTSRTETTAFGEDTDDEMCVGVLYISI